MQIFEYIPQTGGKANVCIHHKMLQREVSVKNLNKQNSIWGGLVSVIQAAVRMGFRIRL